ncbi:amidase family protein [Dactylosporangium aurantiacum]|nr:amidase family protein [Dactylosporangium aurantiacum]MDG6106611.1 amidase family protein [Dactylosporangium aurantiacum]
MSAGLGAATTLLPSYEPIAHDGPAALRGRLAGTRAALAAGRRTVTEHVGALLERIRAVDGELGAYVTVGGEPALRAAAEADRRIRRLGRDAWRHQPLLGVTVAVKDLIQTAQLPTGRGSLLRNGRPQADPPLVARLRSAGAIIIGKTTTSEYGWSASTASRVAQATRNPWSARHSAGGSSGGSAAAVAAGLCDAAIGTDGAGSIRIPASFCGIVGYKPSYGLVPYVPSCADRLAHAGPMTARVADAAELARVMTGAATGDPDSALRHPGRRVAGRSLRIAWIEFPGTSDEVRQAAEPAMLALSGLGHRVEQVDPPFADPYLALVTVLAAAEAAGTAPQDEADADPGRLAVARHGRTLGAAALVHAEETRLRLRVRLTELMQRYDALAMCTVPTAPFAVDAIGPAWAADPADLLWLAWAPGCYPFNLTGQPAISLPAGRTAAGLPVGVQLVGPVGGDVRLLTLAGRLEAALTPAAE